MKANNMILPASCVTALREVVDPGLMLLPVAMRSDPARLLCLAIMKQESGLRTRIQDGQGPAHGLAQFERVGVRGVLNFRSTKDLAAALCETRGIEATVDAVYAELLQDDLLAVGFTRLNLYTDPSPLPKPGEIDVAWAYYVRVWNPGKPNRDRWSETYPEALAAVELN